MSESPAVIMKNALGSWYQKNLAALSALWSPADAKRMYLCAWNSISRNPDLLKCSRQSLVTCMVQAAEMRLYPGVLQECAFVPYKNKKTGLVEAQFIPQYQGLAKLAYQSGLVTRIVADVVYEKDEFDYCQGSETYLRHKKALGERGKPIAVYCYVDFKDGGSKYELLSVSDVEKVRSRSRGQSSEYSPWNTDWDEMAKKTAIKRALKTVPKSFELAQAIEVDDAHEAGEVPSVVFDEQKFTPPETEAADLKAKVARGRGRPKKEEVEVEPQAPESEPESDPFESLARQEG